MSELVEELYEAMNKKGYVPIGTGLYSVVYDSNRSNHVLKFFTSEDKGYVAFLKLISRHRNNPHFPRIQGYTKLKGRYHGVHVVKIKKLDNCLKTCMLLGFSGEETRKVAISKVIENLINTYRHITPDILNKYAVNKINSWKTALNDPLLFKTCRLLGLYAKQHDIIIDMHIENVMQRDEIVVIIDPYKV